MEAGSGGSGSNSGPLPAPRDEGRGASAESRAVKLNDVAAVHRERDPGVARLLEALLSEEGISCHVLEKLQTPGGLITISPYPTLIFEILVPREDLSKARRLIEDFLETGAGGPATISSPSTLKEPRTKLTDS
jgi:hypothetical protein